MRIVVALAAASVVFGLSCATTPKKKHKRPKPPEQVQSTTPSTEEMDKSILDQTLDTAAKELECPKDQLLARCTKHDAQGGCIAVNVKGCDKTLDYQFGGD